MISTGDAFRTDIFLQKNKIQYFDEDITVLTNFVHRQGI